MIAVLSENSPKSQKFKITEKEKSEIKGQIALDDYLINSGIKDAYLSIGNNETILGEDLKSSVEKSIYSKRMIDKMSQKLGFPEVIAQLSILGFMNEVNIIHRDNLVVM